MPAFTLTAPASGTFSVGQTIAIQWTAANVPAGSTVALCYDTDTLWNGNENWITYNQAAANGSGSYDWDTTGVTPGTYYIAGYLFANGTPTYSHIQQPFTLQTAPSPPTFSLLSPTSGTFTAGQTVQIVWNAGNVPASSTVALGYDTGTSSTQRDLDHVRPGRQQRLRQLRLEHHRRARRHVLHRRLSLADGSRPTPTSPSRSPSRRRRRRPST